MGNGQFDSSGGRSSITRRRFVSTAAGLGLTGVMHGLGARAARADDATPKSGGHLKLGLGGASTTDSMDPATTTNSVGAFQNRQTYNCLVEVDAHGNALPELAEAWESNGSADVWTFTLRNHVEFHNGKSLTADDAVYSIRRHLGKDSASAAKGMLSDVADVKADGARRVIVSLASGNVDLPYVFSDYHLGVVPAGFTDWQKPVGTGPFVMTRYAPGVLSTGQRNGNYFKSGRPYVDSVEVVSINDWGARFNALRSGDVHIVNRVDSRIANRISQSGQAKVAASPGRTHYCFVMDTRKAPLADNNLRLAFKYAIDRERILKNVLAGYGQIGNDQSIPQSDPFYYPLPQHDYDPEKARFYLRKAGEENLAIKLSAADGAFAGAVDMALLFQDSARAAGINVTVVHEADDGYWDNIWLKKPFYMSWFGGRPTADMMLSLAYKGGAPWNDTFWRNDRFDALLAEAKSSLDLAKRRQMYGEMQRLIWDQGGYLIPVFGDSIDAHLPNIGGFELNPNAELMGGHCSEAVWINSA